jgi:hypothetical protein
MPEVRKTVGVYERPEKRGGLRIALVVAAVLMVVLGVVTVAVFAL